MDWQKQMEQMVGSWTEMQRNMWGSWVESVRRFGQPPQGPKELRQEYERQLAAWEDSVQKALDAQKEWAGRWSQQMSGVEQAPEPVVRWMEQMQGMMQGWTQSQHQLWTAWFESLRTMDPGEATGRWEQDSQQVLEAWQQAAERAQEALGNWAQMAKEAGVDVAVPADPARVVGADQPGAGRSTEPGPAPARPSRDAEKKASPARKATSRKSAAAASTRKPAADRPKPRGPAKKKGG